MLTFAKKSIRKALGFCGYDIVSSRSYVFDDNNKIINTVMPYTMTSPLRVNALVNAVNYLINNRIDGAFVECGVYKGGSTMAMALACSALNEKERDIYLYDTFSGMTTPSDIDVNVHGEQAVNKFNKCKISEKASSWCFASLDEVQKNMFSTRYNRDRIHFVEGKVEDTIPRCAPEKIALLRLDTDWYESTKHEMEHLFPLLQRNGVLIIDDYGSWRGSRKAVDEYLLKHDITMLLTPLDSSGARMAVKVV